MSLHRDFFEASLPRFAVFTTIAISIGGLVEILPMYTAEYDEAAMAHVTPYTPLELKGRDIYVREGCYNCHSQMIRPFRSETLRYGPWTRAEEYAYDRPFQLGSRRIGPDLQREGGKYSDDWHYEHMRDPRSMTSNSIMPSYPWLIEDSYEMDDVKASVVAMKRLGVPYSVQDVANLEFNVTKQSDAIVARLAEKGITTESDREIVALIAYLQRLGTDGRAFIEEN